MFPRLACNLLFVKQIVSLAFIFTIYVFNSLTKMHPSKHIHWAQSYNKVDLIQ